MIQKDEIQQKSTELKISAKNVQRDYVFGWILAGLYSQTKSGALMILKGGNAIRKAYLPNARFSKDLDFSVESAIDPNAVHNDLNTICRYVQDKTGVVFDLSRTAIKEKPSANTADKLIYEGRVYFDNFGDEEEAVIKVQLDITSFDKIYLPVQSQQLIHQYSDANECIATVRCQKLEEVLASKMNLLLQRQKSSDLFDLFYSAVISNNYGINRTDLVKTFLKKTIYESAPQSAKDLLINIPLGQFSQFWNELIVPVVSFVDFGRVTSEFGGFINELFNLLPTPQPAYATIPTPAFGGGRGSRYPGGGFSGFSSISYFSSAERNTIISAGRANHMVRMTYDGYDRYVEPYSLEYKVRKKDGVGMEYFYGWDTSGGNSGTVGIKSFIYNKIQSLEETNMPFSPRFPVEF